MALSTLPENDSVNEAAFAQQTKPEKELVTYVMGYVEEWQRYRELNFRKDWDIYYRMWKGVWHNDDRTRNSERSKLVSPALQQAIEIQISEMEEATFNKKNWFDISDNVQDEDKSEMEGLRDQLLEDSDRAQVPASISEVYLYGGLYGTGVGKIVVDEVLDTVIDPATAQPTEETVTRVSLVPISPEEFVIDPAARSVDEALGCAHDTVKPRHEIERKKDEGIYKQKELGSYVDEIDVSAKGESKNTSVGDQTRITEWHGLVPRTLLEEVVLDLDEDEELEDLSSLTTKEDVYEEELVESIVTIANGSVLLRAVENPYLFRDRSIIAYQHDRVPNRFWGRGVAEKGINAQRALDAELRARIDGLALTIHPMMGVDGTRLPRGVRPSVGPGKTIVTNGPPSEVLAPLNFGNINAETFAQGSELERMIQMATGSMDTATSSASNPRNNTASGMSMLASSMIKRTKRTMQNVERDFLTPLVRKMAWRYMQFDNTRYPIDDYDFVPRSAMGMMAREFEQTQMTQLLSMTPQDSPAFGLILTQIIANSSGENKEEFTQAIAQMYQPQPPDPFQEQVKALELAKLQAEIREIESRTVQNAVNAETREQDADTKEFDAETKRLKVEGEIQDNELDRQSAPTKEENKNA